MAINVSMSHICRFLLVGADVEIEGHRRHRAPTGCLRPEGVYEAPVPRPALFLELLCSRGV